MDTKQVPNIAQIVNGRNEQETVTARAWQPMATKSGMGNHLWNLEAVIRESKRNGGVQQSGHCQGNANGNAGKFPNQLYDNTPKSLTYHN